ncbi:MAG TPA: NADH-quinone oxidoreductase subunit J [Waddliaceae bacterium]
MLFFANPIQWVLISLLIVSSLGVILAKKPVYASLSFLSTLMTLAALYLQLSAEFIAVMQVLVYAGAILVIFMFVIVLFQDAHQQMIHYEAKSSPILIITASASFLFALVFLGTQLVGLQSSNEQLPEGFGTVESLGQALYIDFFFPFEAVILLFLVAVVGALYIGKKSN